MDNRSSRSGLSNFNLIIGMVMTLVYIGLGAVILMKSDFLPNLPANFRNIFAAVLIVFGLLRAFRTYQAYGR